MGLLFGGGGGEDLVWSWQSNSSDRYCCQLSSGLRTGEKKGSGESRSQTRKYVEWEGPAVAEGALINSPPCFRTGRLNNTGSNGVGKQEPAWMREEGSDVAATNSSS